MVGDTRQSDCYVGYPCILRGLFMGKRDIDAVPKTGRVAKLKIGVRDVCEKAALIMAKNVNAIASNSRPRPPLRQSEGK